MSCIVIVLKRSGPTPARSGGGNYHKTSTVTSPTECPPLRRTEIVIAFEEHWLLQVGLESFPLSSRPRLLPLFYQRQWCPACQAFLLSPTAWCQQQVHTCLPSSNWTYWPGLNMHFSLKETMSTFQTALEFLVSGSFFSPLSLWCTFC